MSLSWNLLNTWCLTWHEFQALESSRLASRQKQPWCPTSPQGLHRMWWSDLDTEIFRQGSSEPLGGPPPLPWGWVTKTSTRCWCPSTHRCQQWTPSDRRWTHYPSHRRGRHMIRYHSSWVGSLVCLSIDFRCELVHSLKQYNFVSEAGMYRAVFLNGDKNRSGARNQFQLFDASVEIVKECLF